MSSDNLISINEEKVFKNQANKLLAYLKKKGSITKQQAYSMLGIWNSGARILDLRQQGYDIETVMVERYNSAGRKYRVAKYIFKEEKTQSNEV